MFWAQCSWLHCHDNHITTHNGVFLSDTHWDFFSRQLSQQIWTKFQSHIRCAWCGREGKGTRLKQPVLKNFQYQQGSQHDHRFCSINKNLVIRGLFFPSKAENKIDGTSRQHPITLIDYLSLRVLRHAVIRHCGLDIQHPQSPICWRLDLQSVMLNGTSFRRWA